MAAKLSLFMPHSEVANQIEQLLWNKFFNTIFSLESDQMTALWANDILNSTFYVTISNNIANWTTFIKEIFRMINSESDKMTTLIKWLLSPLFF